jgi:hypothetical protein
MIVEHPNASNTPNESAQMVIDFVLNQACNLNVLDDRVEMIRHMMNESELLRMLIRSTIYAKAASLLTLEIEHSTDPARLEALAKVVILFEPVEP